jgi:hypothetical protein
MRKVIVLICLFFLSACEKYPFLPDKNSETIFGNWQWNWTGCWNSGYYLLADTAGYSIKITFNREGNYYKYKNGALMSSSRYRLEFSENYKEERIYKLTIENDNKDFRALIIGDTLSLSEYNVRDACEVFYLRQ